MFTNLLIACSLLAILFIIAFVFVPLWRKRHDAESGLYARTQEDNKLSVDYALKRLNCKPRWTKDHDTLEATYRFQSGNFRIVLEKDSPYVRLFYLFFFQADTSKIELVRTVCNRCNLYTETCRLVYSVNSDEGTIDMHVVAGLLITDSTVTEVLERAMLNVFSGRDAFMQEYNQLDNSDKEHVVNDPEKSDAEYKRELFLLREQEMSHQDEAADWHFDPAKLFSLRQLLASTLPFGEVVPIRLAIVQDQMFSTLDDPDMILDYDLRLLMPLDGPENGASSLLKLDFYDSGNPIHVRHLTVDIEAEGNADEAAYYRFTLSLVPLSLDDDVPPKGKHTENFMVSMLIGMDKMPTKQIKDKFRYIWKEAMAKQKNGQEKELTDDERLMLRVADPKLGFCLYNGRSLFLQKRYFESIYLLVNVYKILQSQTPLSRFEETKSTFFDVCFMLGFSFSELKQYDRALFYLDLTLPAHRIDSTTAYVNALVNSHDARALGTVETLLDSLQQSEEDGQLPTQLETFRHFLMRRQASLLIDQKRYSEAETLLKSMLNDPDNSDFALKELAHIQKLKGN